MWQDALSLPALFLRTIVPLPGLNAQYSHHISSLLPNKIYLSHFFVTTRPTLFWQS